MLAQLQPCLACRERLPRTRGLCDRCHGRARRAVARGETSWAELEVGGQALPPQKMGHAWMRGFQLRPEPPSLADQADAE
jgi:hypothetical protein